MSKNYLIILILFLCLAINVLGVNAASEAEIDYQAKLTNLDGEPIVDGDYPMKFEIWHTKDASKILWQETWIETNKVKVKNGVFEIKLGKINPINFDFKESDGYHLSCLVGCCYDEKEKEVNWNSGMKFVKEIKLADLKFKKEALNNIEVLEKTEALGELKVLENLDKVIEPLIEVPESFIENGKIREYSISNLFPKLWQMVSDLFSNFTQKVEQSLASLGLVVKDGIAVLEKLTSHEITVENIYIKKAEIEKARIKNLEVSEKIQLYDQTNNEIYCVWIEKGDWIKVKEKCEDYLGSVDIIGEPENLTIENNFESAAAIETTFFLASSTTEDINNQSQTSTTTIIDQENNSLEKTLEIEKIITATTSENFHFEY